MGNGVRLRFRGWSPLLSARNKPESFLANSEIDEETQGEIRTPESSEGLVCLFDIGR